MKRFYVNLYPIVGVLNKDGSPIKDIEPGTVFIITGMSFNTFELKTIKKSLYQPILIEPRLLELGFKETDEID